MLEGLARLFELSRLDGELTACEQEQAAIPAARARIAEAREAAAQKLAAARESLHQGEAEQRRAESELQDQEALLAKLEGQQHQVKSNEAYRALLHEMDRAREAISECETRILEAMETIESAQREQGAAEQWSRVEGERLEAEDGALTAREGVLEAEIVRLRQERERVCACLERDLLERYQRIAARRRPAVAVVSGETCTGCHVGIPPQLYIELLKGERVVSCDSCHRILLHRDRLSPLAG